MSPLAPAGHHKSATTEKTKGALSQTWMWRLARGPNIGFDGSFTALRPCQCQAGWKGLLDYLVQLRVVTRAVVSQLSCLLHVASSHQELGPVFTPTAAGERGWYSYMVLFIYTRGRSLKEQ